MNTVKYRAWMPKEKKWYKGGAIQLTALQGNTFGLSEANGKIVQLQQWTGLTDRLGVEIYEGDIIECKGHRPGEHSVSVMTYDHQSATRAGFGLQTVGWQKHEIEVIGNIYENPELLEAEL